MKKICGIALFSLILQVSGQGTFKGFEILKIPRENMPIGAEWINGVGPNGAGASADNIGISASISSYAMDKSFKQGLDLAIVQFLNLGAEYQNTASIEYRNLSIHTVKDFSKISIRSGQYILYESIRADSIFLRVDKEISGDLKLKLDEKLKNLKIQASGDYRKGVTFSGEKLFLAYRVFKLGKSKTSKKEKELSGPGLFAKRLVETKVQDYRFSFNDSKLTECVFPANGPKNNEKLPECSKQYLIDVHVLNLKSQDVQGQPIEKRFPIMNSSKTSFVISNRAKSGIVSDYIEIYYNLIPSMIAGDLQLNKASSKIRISRSITKFKMLKKTKAPGW